MNKRTLRTKLNRARKRLEKESKLVELSQRRKMYWLKQRDALEYRLDLVNEGQIEMNLEGATNGNQNGESI